MFFRAAQILLNKQTLLEAELSTEIHLSPETKPKHYLQ